MVSFQNYDMDFSYQEDETFPLIKNYLREMEELELGNRKDLGSNSASAAYTYAT